MKCWSKKCNKDAFCHGLCKRHYEHAYNFLLDREDKKKFCWACKAPVKAFTKGLCKKHYDFLIRFREEKNVCWICGNEHFANSLCNIHWHKLYYMFSILAKREIDKMSPLELLKKVGYDVD